MAVDLGRAVGLRTAILQRVGAARVDLVGAERAGRDVFDLEVVTSRPAIADLGRTLHAHARRRLDFEKPKSILLLSNFN